MTDDPRALGTTGNGPPAPTPVTNVYVQQPAAPIPGPNHVLHGILSVLTGGLWLPVWAGITFRHGRRVKRAR
jgi:hypothetical protein